MTPVYMERISINSDVMVGKPCIRGTRIPVNLIVRMAGQGVSYDEILSAYPHITGEDIDAVAVYAHGSSAGGLNVHQHYD
jgi:uncharacterized protein (DUF433 family)